MRVYWLLNHRVEAWQLLVTLFRVAAQVLVV
jgi:hypothetical protein